MKVLIFFPRPTRGGIERNLAIWLNCLNAKQDVSVLLFGSPSKYSTLYEWPWIEPGSWWQIQFRYLFHLIRTRPDAVICFQYSVIGVIARALGIAVAIRLSNDPDHAKIEKSLKRHISEIGKRLLYPLANTLIANSRELAERAIGYGRKVRLIRTPVQPSTVTQTRELKFLFAGRLAPQKNLVELIEAFEAVLKEHQDATLTIVGHGQCYARLKSETERRGLFHHVIFEGWQTYPAYEQYRYFVLPSLYEGSPNALIEAVGHGLYPIITPFSSGGREVLNTLGYGHVASGFDAGSLADAINKAIDEDWSFNPARKGYEQFLKEFSITQTCRDIDDLLTNLQGRMPT